MSVTENEPSLEGFSVTRSWPGPVHGQLACSVRSQPERCCACTGKAGLVAVFIAFSNGSAAFVLQFFCGNVECERAVSRQQLGALAGVRRRAARLLLHRVSSDDRIY